MTLYSMNGVAAVAGCPSKHMVNIAVIRFVRTDGEQYVTHIRVLR